MSKARKKRNRAKARKPISLSGGASVNPRPSQGYRADLHQPPDDVVALSARARRAGIKEEDARDPLAGSEIGWCINKLRKDSREQHALHDEWQSLSAAWITYVRRCLGLNPHPQSSSLAAIPDRMETDQSHSIDIRTPDERDRASHDAWFAWLDRLMTLPADQQHALRGHLQGYGKPIWHDAATAPTRTGVLAVDALAALRGG